MQLFVRVLEAVVDLLQGFAAMAFNVIGFGFIAWFGVAPLVAIMATGIAFVTGSAPLYEVFNATFTSIAVAGACVALGAIVFIALSLLVMLSIAGLIRLLERTGLALEE